MTTRIHIVNFGPNAIKVEQTYNKDYLETPDGPQKGDTVLGTEKTVYAQQSLDEFVYNDLKISEIQ